MSEPIQYDRRRFIGTAVMATAGAGLVGARLRESGSRDESGAAAIRPSTNRSLGESKQIDAGNLKVGYAEAGPSNGPPAILLHGCADGINRCAEAAPLAASGYRVIVPHVRATKRNGQQTPAPSEVMALMDALNIQKALVGGLDEGARTAEVMAAQWPLRVKGIAPVSGYVVVSLAANQRPLPPKEELAWWYEYYFAPARGR